MKIGMDHLFIFHARFACSTGIGFTSVLTAYIFCISQGKGQGAAPLRSGQKLGMAYPSFLYRTDKMVDSLLMSRYMRKIH